MNRVSRRSRGEARLPEQAVPLQFGISRFTDVLAEYRAIAAGVAIAPSVSVVIPAWGLSYRPGGGSAE